MPHLETCTTFGKMGHNLKNCVTLGNIGTPGKMGRTWENVPQWKQFATPKQLDHNLRNYATLKNVPHLGRNLTIILRLET